MLNIFTLLAKSNLNHKQINGVPVRMAKIRKTDHTKWWQGCGRTGAVTHCCWKCEMVQGTAT